MSLSPVVYPSIAPYTEKIANIIDVSRAGVVDWVSVGLAPGGNDSDGDRSEKDMMM